MANIKDIFKGILPRDKKQWQVFLACVGISTILWGLLKFSEEREDELEVLLNFTNFPKKEMMVDDLPVSMPVKIRAQGFDLISRSIGFNKPTVSIDLSKALIVKRGNVNQYVWLPKMHSKEITQAIGANLKSSIYPVDSVKVLFSEIIEKEVVTGFNYNIKNAKEHFIFKQPLLSPYKVRVRGAKSVLQELDTIKTEFVEIDVLEEDLDLDYRLIKPFGVDSIFKDSVRVFLGVEVLKNYEFEVPISILNAPDSLEFKLFPNEVVVSFTCGSSDMTKVSPHDFGAQVNFEDVKSSFKRLSVELHKFSPFVRDIRVEPASVEYIVKSKD